MQERVKAYKGSEPYAFVSYSHRDFERVLNIISRLAESGCRIWYDEGIEQTSRYDAVLYNAIKSCGVFMVFFSTESVKSQYVIDEVLSARSINKPILPVFLEECELPDELKMRLVGIHQLYSWRYSAQGLLEELKEGLRPCGAGTVEPSFEPVIAAAPNKETINAPEIEALKPSVDKKAATAAKTPNTGAPDSALDIDVVSLAEKPAFKSKWWGVVNYAMIPIAAIYTVITIGTLLYYNGDFPDIWYAGTTSYYIISIIESLLVVIVLAFCPVTISNIFYFIRDFKGERKGFLRALPMLAVCIATEAFSLFFRIIYSEIYPNPPYRLSAIIAISLAFIFLVLYCNFNYSRIINNQSHFNKLQKAAKLTAIGLCVILALFSGAINWLLYLIINLPLYFQS